METVSEMYKNLPSEATANANPSTDWKKKQKFQLHVWWHWIAPKTQDMLSFVIFYYVSTCWFFWMTTSRNWSSYEKSQIIVVLNALLNFFIFLKFDNWQGIFGKKVLMVDMEWLLVPLILVWQKKHQIENL